MPSADQTAISSGSMGGELRSATARPSGDSLQDGAASAGPDKRGFFERMLDGALKGDMAGQDNGIAGTVGQTITGLIPFVGMAADIRDTSAAVSKWWKTGEGFGDVLLAGTGWLPGGDIFKGLGRSGRKVSKATAGINSSSVSAAASSAAKLNRHQRGLYDRFQHMTPGEYIELPKKMLKVGDMVNVSKALQVELALFTKGGTRRLMLGYHTSVPFTPGMGKKWASKGWRWSGHTHPQGSGIPLEASKGMNHDTGVLWRFAQYGKQRFSGIWDWDGNWTKFSPDPDPPFTTLP